MYKPRSMTIMYAQPNVMMNSYERSCIPNCMKFIPDVRAIVDIDNHYNAISTKIGRSYIQFNLEGRCTGTRRISNIR